MKNELIFSLAKFEKALKRLNEGISAAKDELDKDGVIQRFEFTVELFWKTLKIYLESEGITCTSPKECLKAAFKKGMLDNEEVYLNMISDRNIMSHLYNKKESEEVYQRIKKQYLKNLKKIFKEITKSA